MQNDSSPSPSVPRLTHSPKQIAWLLAEIKHCATEVASIELEGETPAQRTCLTQFAQQLDLLVCEAQAHFPLEGP